MNPYSRRHFLKQTALSAGALPLLPSALSMPLSLADTDLPEIHIFSKHLQFLNYADMAEAAANMGFNGVDLTVRPDGHVKPERVSDELPRVAETLKKAGLPPNLMTTTVGDATNPTDNQVLKIAAKLGFRTYRMKWYSYDQKKNIPDDIQGFQQQLRALSELNKSLNLTGCYQNHAGLLVGSSVWELWEILKTADPKHMGVQYDIRHATVEGGQSWPNGLRLLLPSIKSITIKDFIWEKKTTGPMTGKWDVQDVPLGEGMVDFKTYFNLLKKSRLRAPISLHIEYPMGGAEHGATKLSIPQNEVFMAMKRDLNRLKELWQSA
ncbi:sugar phosphate isomerase/epimerase family protein [Spirosoma validum]|uniref:Sugar phosphate isomerase/epimerase n=1 Tax=Spirosoma validum TaxID=2771355 RepID=A0A927GGW6_9BACT|nr:sugar phosphate isomerase/epimerase family protein [Spirosoma validum]MBD2757314.1 sugar phosphate isomerase/epimerase [Spirosoma validum]